MLERTYDGQTCSIARSLEVVGERWTLLILRDTLLRPRRFDDLHRGLGVARNVLTDRLQRLCEEGLLERRLYQERPPRHEYASTEKARELLPALAALIGWGDKYYAPDGPPRLILHRSCGGAVVQSLRCETCGAALDAEEIESRPGPGASLAAPSPPDRPAALGKSRSRRLA